MSPFSKLISGTNHQNKLRSVLLFAFVLVSFFAKSQAPQYSFAPADSQFVFTLSRQKSEVIISLTFNDSLVFDYVAIERKADFNQEFSQCKYITYDEVKTKGRHLVKHDTYAYPASSDVLYRIKMGTAEGAIRIYPAVTMPAVKK